MREWDGDYVVFSPLSGHTHFLDIVAGELLKRLASGGARESELCAQLAAFLEVPNDAAFAVEIADILARLDDLGLVAPAD